MHPFLLAILAKFLDFRHIIWQLFSSFSGFLGYKRGKLGNWVAAANFAKG